MEEASLLFESNHRMKLSAAAAARAWSGRIYLGIWKLPRCVMVGAKREKAEANERESKLPAAALQDQGAGATPHRTSCRVSCWRLRNGWARGTESWTDPKGRLLYLVTRFEV